VRKKVFDERTVFLYIILFFFHSRKKIIGCEKCFSPTFFFCFRLEDEEKKHYDLHNFVSRKVRHFFFVFRFPQFLSFRNPFKKENKKEKKICFISFVTGNTQIYFT